MARQSKRRKFANNQPVVIRFGERKLVGKVVFARPIGKKFTYDVLCEDTKVYSELQVDVAMNQCIDTYLTRLFYRKYKIDETYIPEADDDIIYNVDQENKCYYNDKYIPLVVDRLRDGTIDGATAYFNSLRDNLEPELYEELGFAEKEICPRHGKISSCWQLNR